MTNLELGSEGLSGVSMWYFFTRLWRDKTVYIKKEGGRGKGQCGV
jgi:hypothetical protein